VAHTGATSSSTCARRSTHGAGTDARRRDPLRCSGPGGPGWSPTQASQRSVRARIRAYGSSDDGFAIQSNAVSRTAILVVTVIRGSEYDASDVFPGPGSNTRHPLSVFPSLNRVPRDQSRLRRYYEGAATSCRPSAALRCLRLAVPRLHSVSSLLGGRVHRRGLELVTGSSSREFAEETTGSPSSWGISIVRLHVFLPTPAGLLAPDHYGAAAWPLDPQVQRLPRKVFRRPIAWLSDWLSTPRRADYSDPTQDSLPVAGQALPDGLSTHKIPLRGFRSASYISSSSPKLCLAQWGDRCALHFA